MMCFTENVDRGSNNNLPILYFQKLHWDWKHFLNCQQNIVRLKKLILNLYFKCVIFLYIFSVCVYIFFITSRLPDFSQIQVPGRRTVGGGGAGPSTARDENDPKWIREMLLANPDQVAMLKQQNPRLAEALNNPDEFTKVRHFPCSVFWGANSC